MIKAFLAAALLAAAALAPAAARAHEVLHEVERGRAIAVRAYHADGEVLRAQYEVYSPADPRIPHQKGRTDRSGWLAFVPDAPGKWRVKLIDASGHGLDVEVDATATPTQTQTQTQTPTPTPTATPTPSFIAFVLRPLLGLAAIAAVFATLFAVYRRKGSPKP